MWRLFWGVSRVDPARRAEDAEVRVVMSLSVVSCVRLYHFLSAVGDWHPNSMKVGMLKIVGTERRGSECREEKQGV